MYRFLQIINIAVRNVFRNTRRTIITMASIVLGISALVVFNGFVDYTIWGLRESTIQTGIGHLQIATSEKYFVEGTFDPYSYLIENAEEIAGKVKSIKEVKAIVPQLSFSGTISFGGKTGICMFIANPPEYSSTLYGFRTMVDGRDFLENDKYSVIVGKGVAEKMGLKVGDTVTAMVPTVGGGVNAIDLNVIGITTTGSSDLDNIIVYMDLQTAQELTFATHPSLLIVKLQKTEDTDKVYGQLRKLIPSMVIKKWHEVAGYYRQVESMYKTSLSIAEVIILLVAVFAIINTMMMSVFERTREIGTIMAIGAKRVDVLSMFTLEGAVIGLIGGIIGIILGIVIAFIINNVFGGIYIPPPPGRSEGYNAYINLPTFLVCVKYTLLAFGFSLLGSVYPAIRAVRLNVVDALRYT